MVNFFFFFGSRSPCALSQAMFSIRKNPEQLEDAAWGSRKGRRLHSQPRDGQSVNANSAGDCCVVSVATRARLTGSQQSVLLGRTV